MKVLRRIAAVAVLALIAPSELGVALEVNSEIGDHLVPTRIFRNGGKTQIIFPVPCGAAFLGYFTSLHKSKVRIAAVVRRSEFLCAGMATFRAVEAHEIGLKRGQRLAEFSPSFWRRQIAMSHLVEMHEVKTGSSTELQMVHESNCRKTKGLFLQMDPDRVANVGVAEVVSNSSEQDCPYQQEVMPVKYLSSAVAKAVIPLSDQLPELENLYQLRIAPTPRESIKQLPSGGIALAYHARCNERLVGIAVSSRSASDKTDRRIARGSSVGVVVAHFYNRSCPKGAPKVTWEVVKAPFLNLAAGLQEMDPAAVGELTIKTPLSYDSGSGRGIKVSYYGGCDHEIATVFSPTSNSAVRVGILAPRNDSACDQPVQVQTMHQPMFIRRAGHAKIYPLRVNAF